MNTMVAGRTINQIPFAQVGEAPSLVVLNGGQGFVRKACPKRLARDARRTATLLPHGQSFVLLGYHPKPAANLAIDDILADTITAIE